MSEDFQDWVGRSVTRHDVVSERLVAEYEATMQDHLFAGGVGTPPGFHFGLAPAIHPPEKLGPDGAELKGLFVPPITYSRRMWAGGRIDSFHPIRVHDQIVRRSTITGVSHRQGKAGAFYIVSILHEIEANGTLAVRERQDLLFREGGRASPGTPAAPAASLAGWAVEAGAMLLFRFSAFTFNGHRIHYDLDFARREEGYDGLLVHGPLQAALLLNLMATVQKRVPKAFEYRCLAPLTSGQTFRVEALAPDLCRIIDARGVLTCEGRGPETA